MRTSDVLLIAATNRMCADGTARRLRERAGLSQAQVGAACGVSHAAVSRWELGERVARSAAALSYAKLLDALARAENEAVPA